MLKYIEILKLMILYQLRHKYTNNRFLIYFVLIYNMPNHIKSLMIYICYQTNNSENINKF